MDQWDIFSEIEEDNPETPSGNSVDQNWIRVNDYRDIVDAFDSSGVFESEGEEVVTGQNHVESHPQYNPEFRNVSYSAPGIRVDVMPDYEDGGTAGIVRATVVDREEEGFHSSVDEYVESVSKAEDVDTYNGFSDEIRIDMRDPDYEPGSMARAD